MRTRFVVLLAIIFGLATAALAYFYLDNAKKSLDQTQYVEIVVAAQNIPADKTIQPAMVVTRKIPADLKQPQETDNKEDVVGKILMVPVTAGQSILTSQVYASGDKKQGLAYLVPVGKRAVTVGVDDVSGVAGMILPGDRVDVLVTVSANNEDYTVLPLQDVVVLAVGQKMDANMVEGEKTASENTITLAVQYNDAKPLMLAAQKGSIQLLLRNPVDHERGYYGPYKMGDLIKGTAMPAAGGKTDGKN